MKTDHSNNPSIILAIETATEACSAAVAIGDKIITRFSIAPREHTKLILTMMDEVLKEADVKLNQVDAIAFSRGPGAFTGIRIAVGVAHGVALSMDKLVLPISTLAAIAQQMQQQQATHHCLAAMDARMGEVYWGKYTVKKGLMRLQGTEAVTKPENLLTALNTENQETIWTAAGSGWDQYAQQLNLTTHQKLIKIDNILPSAEYIAKLAVEDWKQGKAINIEDAQPIYLRNKVAQTVAERKRAK